MTEREIISEIRKYVKKNADNPIYRCDNGWINLSGINSRIYAEIIVLSKKLIDLYENILPSSRMRTKIKGVFATKGAKVIYVEDDGKWKEYKFYIQEFLEPPRLEQRLLKIKLKSLEKEEEKKYIELGKIISEIEEIKERILL